MKPTLLSLLSIIFVLAANAQAPLVEWRKTISGNKLDYLLSIQQTNETGYVLGGYSYSNNSGDKSENNWDSTLTTSDYWIFKLDSAGDYQWQNTIGGTGNDALKSIQQTSDDGYILGGWSGSNISGDKTEETSSHGPSGEPYGDYWIVKLDASGNIQWQNTIGGNGWDLLVSVQQTSDGGYFLGGYSTSGISRDKTENSIGPSFAVAFDYWVLKLNPSGNIQWQNTIGGFSYDTLSSAKQTADGGYILGGYSESDISGDKTENSLGGLDYWVVKLDVAGNIQWQNTIGGTGADRLKSIQQTTDGGYILGGYSNSAISGDKTENSLGNTDYWIIKLNSSGAIQWQNTIGGNKRDELYSIEQTADGGYISGGSSESPISGDKTQYSSAYDFWVVKLSTTGNILWQSTVGTGDNDYLYSIQQTTDGGYFLGGYFWNYPYYFDYQVVKLGSSDLHISGQVVTDTGIPIPGTTVTLAGSANQTTTTLNDGRYSFTVPQGGTYTITPSKTNDSIINNGITGVDVLLMRRHILGLGNLGTPYKIIAAAEVNADGDTSITTQDILLTRSLILGNITSFPTNRLWQFVSSDYVFPDTQHPFPFSSTRTYTNITTNQTNQNFIGIKLGDVNGSWED